MLYSFICYECAAYFNVHCVIINAGKNENHVANVEKQACDHFLVSQQVSHRQPVSSL